MNLALKYPPRYRVEDYEKWEGNWELIEGIPYALASPTFEHQRTVGKIFKILDEEVESKCPQCKAGIDTDYVIDEHTVVRPDVFVVCGEIREKIYKRPILIFEVVSKSSSETDEMLKRELYEREGVPCYILVHPPFKKAKLLRLGPNGYINTDEVTDGVLHIDVEGCTLEIDFSKVWD